MTTMTRHNVQLTASELGLLWAQYVNDSLSVCILSYFINKCEDEQIMPILQYAVNLSKKHLDTIAKIYKHERVPLPIGFTEDDVNTNAPKLFTDTFNLLYLQQMAVIGMAGATAAIGVSARSDVSNFFHEVLASASRLHNRVRKLALNKGVFVRPPTIPIPDQPDFAEKQRFLFDFIGKHKRPMTAIEITHLYLNIQTNYIGKALIMAFAQVCKSNDVKKFFLKGKEMASKHIQTFSSLLTNADIAAPVPTDVLVLDHTETPFSDKLMMFHISSMIATGIGNYGAAAGTCMRLDLSTTYMRLAGEIALYAEDGANIMIKHRWLEKPPQAIDRQALANQTK